MSDIVGPYSVVAGHDNRGIEGKHLVGFGLINAGSSGGTLLDNQSGRICGVVNYLLNDNSKVGFDVLPDNNFMREEINKFLMEQVEKLNQ